MSGFFDNLVKAGIIRPWGAPPMTTTPTGSGVSAEQVERILSTAETDCGCRIPHPFREVAEFAVEAALTQPEPDNMPSIVKADIETRFWSVVDQDGLSGLPSDMWDALDILVQRAALSTIPVSPAGEGE